MKTILLGLGALSSIIGIGTFLSKDDKAKDKPSGGQGGTPWPPTVPGIPPLGPDPSVVVPGGGGTPGGGSIPPSGGGSTPGGGSIPGGGGTTPGGSAPPKLPAMDLGGASFVGALPNEPTIERDQMIVEAIRRHHYYRPLDWVPIETGGKGPDGVHRTCTVWVSHDAIALGNEFDFVRVNVRHPTAQVIADLFDSHLPTSRISDIAWKSADVKLRPHNQTPGPRMAFTDAMIEHHWAVENQRAYRPGLVRPVGKDYVNTNLLEGHPDLCAIFGWHMRGAQYRSPGQLEVVQPLATPHSIKFVDYSQTVTLVWRVCLVDGQVKLLTDVMQSPTLAYLVSDEGPLRVIRHPAVPKQKVVTPYPLNPVAVAA